MSDAVLVALITSGLTLIGVIITVIRTNRQTLTNFELSQKDLLHKLELQQKVAQEVTNTKIDNLSAEVHEHNNFAKRVPVIEQRITTLEAQVGVIQSNAAYSHRS